MSSAAKRPICVRRHHRRRHQRVRRRRDLQQGLRARLEPLPDQSRRAFHKTVQVKPGALKVREAQRAPRELAGQIRVESTRNRIRLLAPRWLRQIPY